MIDQKVFFTKTGEYNHSRKEYALVYQYGVVKDKFAGLYYLGNGDYVPATPIVLDFYLILGEDGVTYKVPCSEITIATNHDTQRTTQSSSSQPEEEQPV